MQIESVKIYLSKLIKDGQKWQYLSINGTGNKPRNFLTSLQWIILFISIISFSFLEKGLNSDFVGYVISALSIFVGLFLTLILSVFDKFMALESLSQATEIDEQYKIQRTNFFKQFTSLTGYAIIIAIFCILLLSLTYLTEVFKLNLFYEVFFYIPFGNIKLEYMKFLKLLFVAVYNITILYFLLDFLLIVIYAVTSIHAYMMIEYNRS